MATKIVTRDTLKAVREVMDEKYLIEGEYSPTTTVGKAIVAKELENVSEESGSMQDVPFIMQGTGTKNNSAAVEASSLARITEKKGNAVVVNNLVVNGNFASADGWINNDSDVQTMQVSDGSLILTSIDGYFGAIYQSVSAVADHTYLLKYETSASTAFPTRLVLGTLSGVEYVAAQMAPVLDGTKTCIVGIVTPTIATNMIKIGCDGTTMYVYTGDVWTIENVHLIDLTLYFNGTDNIPADLINDPHNWSRYLTTSETYNTGTITNCNGQYLVCTGRNIYNPESDMARVVPNRTYYYYGLTAGIRYLDDNYNTVRTGMVYNNRTFNTPANCRYIVITNPSKFTVSLYYTPEQGGTGYTQNYPYTEQTYDMGSEELLAFDAKDPDGTIHRNTRPFTDFSTNSWRIHSSSKHIFRTNYAVSNTQAIGICSKYVWTNSILNGVNKTIGILTVGAYSYLAICDASCTTVADLIAALDGVTILLKFSTDSTEQGTPFSEYIEIDNYGTMYWLSTNNNLVSVPQGNKIFYPADYALWLDTAIARTGGDATNIATLDDIAAAITTTLNTVV